MPLYEVIRSCSIEADDEEQAIEFTDDMPQQIEVRQLEDD